MLNALIYWKFPTSMSWTQNSMFLKHNARQNQYWEIQTWKTIITINHSNYISIVSLWIFSQVEEISEIIEMKVCRKIPESQLSKEIWLVFTWKNIRIATRKRNYQKIHMTIRDLFEGDSQKKHWEEKGKVRVSPSNSKKIFTKNPIWDSKQLVYWWTCDNTCICCQS